ncbi:tail fiber domain-containing protein [Erwinia sp. V90_4]|uniref:tail fiber domain-containing protein n=1 Tax=Erwinia sp. V90_4 TaxID=3044239 RepID=UPI00249DD364|nr:tail fiber domain-containing protein [Erwinia sp. V90_4]MDI3441606.1 tail fiber domain-containing protein [Erwinia sp. V90_4]
MPAGTIALTNNSTTVGGTGTAFTTELKAGDFIGVTVGGAPYTMIVASIASNTQLTIVQAYNGPTASGLSWYGVPATLKYAITQQVLNDMATNQRGMIAQLANWQKIYSDAASVTVERPDRSTFTGPSWGYMAAQYANKAAKGANSDITSLTGLTTALSVAQGGTGGKTQAEGRSGLGAAASGANTDITSLTKINATITRDNWVADNGVIVTLDAQNNVSYNNKAFTATTKHNGITLNTSFGYTIASDGSASLSGPALFCTDTLNYTRAWKFQNGTGIIATTSGNITPGASDERVKNIIREITEDEAVRFISGLKPIRYAFKWSPESVKVGYSAQNVESLDSELLSTTPLTIPDEAHPDDPLASVVIEDGKVVDPGEIGAAYLVPVVQQLLRRVRDLENQLKPGEGVGQNAAEGEEQTS